MAEIKKRKRWKLSSIVDRGLSVFNFRPFDDFYTENLYNLKSSDVYMKSIKFNGKTVGVLTHADEKYLYGIIDMSAIMVKLEIDTDLPLEGDLREKYENICKEMGADGSEDKKISDTAVFASQKRIPMLDKYIVHEQIKSQKTKLDNSTCDELCEDEDE